MAIKAIVFDCFGVLVVPTQELLVRDFPDKLSEIKDLALRSDYGYITKQQYSELATELTGLSAEQFQARYWNKGRDHLAFDWLNELRETHSFKIGLLSNISTWRIDEYIPIEERERLFDGVVLSGEVGVVKPSVEIFDIMAERLGVDISECVMIDDLLENVEGASVAGMKTILYGNANQARAELEALLELDNA